MKKFILIVFGLCFLACGGPEPRKPIEVKTGSFFKESTERSKQLLAKEELLFKQIIAKDTVNEYKDSSSGFWFYYNQRNEESLATAQPDDLVTLSYAILSTENDTIYSFNDIGLLNYKVDKQELFPALRNSVKLLKENEMATFLYPSSLAYGYHGDGNKIETNTPIKAVLKIFEINKALDSIQH